MLTDLEKAREENMRLRRIQGDLLVRLAESTALQMQLRGEIERLRQELQTLSPGGIEAKLCREH